MRAKDLYPTIFGPAADDDPLDPGERCLACTLFADIDKENSIEALTLASAAIGEALRLTATEGARRDELLRQSREFIDLALEATRGRGALACSVGSSSL